MAPKPWPLPNGPWGPYLTCPAIGAYPQMRSHPSQARGHTRQRDKLRQYPSSLTPFRYPVEHTSGPIVWLAPTNGWLAQQLTTEVNRKKQERHFQPSPIRIFLSRIRKGGGGVQGRIIWDGSPIPNGTAKQRNCLHGSFQSKTTGTKEICISNRDAWHPLADT